MPYSALVSQNVLEPNSINLTAAKQTVCDARSRGSEGIARASFIGAEKKAAVCRSTSTSYVSDHSPTARNTSTSDFLRVMRGLLRKGNASAGKNNTEETREQWKPRSALDFSGHSFNKSLKEELRQARQRHRVAEDGCAYEVDARFQASERHDHLAQLHSPTKDGSRPFQQDDADPSGDWWKAGSQTKGTFSYASSTSTEPASPGPDYEFSSIPPRHPSMNGRGSRSMEQKALAGGDGRRAAVGLYA